MSKNQIVLLWVILFFTLVAILSGIAANFGSIQIPHAILILLYFASSSGWLATLLHFLYHNWEPANLLFYHIQGMISNSSTQWTLYLNLECTKMDNASASDRIVTILQKDDDRRFKIWHSDSLQKIIKLDGYTMRIRPTRSFDLDEFIELGESTEAVSEHEYVKVELADIHIPYRESRNLIDNKIIPFFEALTNELKPTAQSYSLFITFPNGKNPYFGYFARQVPLSQIRQFALEFDIKISGKMQSVSVTPDEVTILTTGLAPLRILALRYVTFSLRAMPS